MDPFLGRQAVQDRKRGENRVQRAVWPSIRVADGEGVVTRKVTVKDPFQLFSGSFPVTFRVLTPSTSATLILSHTDLCTQFSPLFRSWTSCPPEQASTPTGLHCPSLHLFSCLPRPAPQVPVVPCRSVPQACLCCLFPSLVAPLVLHLTPLASLSTPVGYTV